MIDTDRMQGYIREANPVPHLDDIDTVELGRFVAAHTTRAAIMQAPTKHPTETTPSTPQQPTRRVHRAWAFAAAFVIALATIGMAVVVFRGEEQPVVDDPAPPATIRDTAEPSFDVESLVWTRVPHDEAVFGLPGERGDCRPRPYTERLPEDLGSHCVLMMSVTSGGPGFVAVGGAENAAAVWTSADGATWTRVPHDAASFTWVEGSPIGTLMHAVTEGGPGLVAVGETGRRPAVWTSSDGITWTQVPPEEMGFTAARGGSPLRGVDSGNSRTVTVNDEAVWTSSDGINWSKTPEGFALEDPSEGIWLRDVSAGGPGFVAVGHHVWASKDGLTWSPVLQDDADFAPWPYGSMWSVTEGGPGLVAVGSAEGHPATWTSIDGITWTRVLLEDEGTMYSVVAVADSLITVGEAGGVPAAWTSSDGVTWSRVPHDNAVFGKGVVVSVTSGDEGIVAVGRDGADAAVWIAVPEN